MSEDSLLAHCPVESARTIEWLGQTSATCLPTCLVEIVHDYQHEVHDIDVVDRRDPNSAQTPYDYSTKGDDVDGDDVDDDVKDDDVKDDDVADCANVGCGVSNVVCSSGEERGLTRRGSKLDWMCCHKILAVGITLPLTYWSSILVPMKTAHVTVDAFTCRNIQLGVDRSEYYWRTVSQRDADGNVSEYSEMATRIVTDWSSYEAIEIAGFEYNETQREMQYYVGYHFQRDAIEKSGARCF
jgi:hypothetical protein